MSSPHKSLSSLSLSLSPNHPRTRSIVAPIFAPDSQQS
jgi:hypothetical protein